MNFGSKMGQQRQGFALTSMIDLLFILLIFFMTASMYAQFESELNVQVPVSSESVDTEREATEIIVNVTDDGKFVVNQIERSIPELDDILRTIADVYEGSHIILRGDKETAWRNMVKVLDACKRADIWNVSFSVIPEETAGE
ncbi:biopolymer transporter ExbD [bacterium]|nr:biopolymer transporter ExbD [bacterium]